MPGIGATAAAADRVVQNSGRDISRKPRPGEVFSHWVNAGIYVLEPAVLDAIPGGRAVDFAHEVFPGLLAAGRPVYGYRMAEDEHLWWIDGPDDLRRVEHLWREIAGSGV